MEDNQLDDKQKYLALLHQSDLTCKALIELLTNVSELMRGDVSGYAKQVADRALVLATSLGLKKPETHYIYYAALLHEIGVFCVPPKLQKDLNTQKLNTAEINLLKQIPEMGYLLLMSVDILQPVAKIILYCQEYLDGSGYPKGLKGEQIPFASQILSVVIDYHKIANGRFFQSTVDDFQAFSYIRERSGILYNPDIVENFSQILSFEQTPKAKNDDKILSHELRPGMILSRALFSSNGLELFHKCRVLNDRDINAICNIETMSGKQLEIFVMSTQAQDYSNPFVQADLDLKEISILLGDNINIRDI
jgi:response regulator RpfG family c-di-GMP phosphodiesterase